MDAPYRRPPPASTTPWFAIGCWIVALIVIALCGVYVWNVYQAWLSLGGRP